MTIDIKEIAKAITDNVADHSGYETPIQALSYPAMIVATPAMFLTAARVAFPGTYGEGRYVVDLTFQVMAAPATDMEAASTIAYALMSGPIRDGIEYGRHKGPGRTYTGGAASDVSVTGHDQFANYDVAGNQYVGFETYVRVWE